MEISLTIRMSGRKKFELARVFRTLKESDIREPVLIEQSQSFRS